MSRLAAITMALLLAPGLQAGPPRGGGEPERSPVRRLIAESAGTARVGVHPSTGVARFVRLAPESLSLNGADPVERADDFLQRHGASFGITDPAAELAAPVVRTDRQGWTHLTRHQRFRGVPVFAGLIRLHFDPAGRLRAVNGTFVPGVEIDPRPTRTSAEATTIAVADVLDGLGAPPATPLGPPRARLVVFRSGLAQGVAGRDHLAWQVDVDNGHDVRETVFVDAHGGKIVDRITGIHEALERQVHDTVFDGTLLWSEGDPLPFDSGAPAADDQINGLIDFAEDTYGLFSNLSGGTYLSWDGADGTMHSVWEASFIPCPNATWNGTSTNFCDGVTSDDVVGHEWTHGYTEATGGLIYQWQPGALNESYSDIFGEVLDRINGVGTDAPDTVRSAGDCSTAGGSPPPSLEALAPPSIVGSYFVAGASFNPAPPLSATATVERVDDGDTSDGGSTSDACQAPIGFGAGHIALIDRGTCDFSSKVLRAQDAGAVGAIVVNYTDDPFEMSGSEPAITIPSVMIGSGDGQLIEAELDNGVSVTISVDPAESTSLRWLVGEDSFAFGGPIRDLWNPECFGHPDSVTDARYHCGNSDTGGVHTNSGVPNHGFALAVDGGSFNGQTIVGLGLTKAAHVYWRAMTWYQVPDTDFADHADALEQSCDDLVGVDLTDLTTGLPSGQTIGPSDCDELAKAILAVELRAEPPCDFGPLLSPDPPPLDCGAVAWFDDLDDGATGWTFTNSGVFGEYAPRDWVWTAWPPAGGTGAALFAVDSVNIGNCIPGDDDQSGVMRAETPPIALGGAARVSFDHWVATELGWDGGNVSVSVNGGAYQTIGGASFTFNPYNDTLHSGAEGNTNPLAGEEVFSGTDDGEVSGSWGQSQIDLAAYAAAGDTIRLRFDLGVDGCNGLVGWFVDNVRVCTDEPGAGLVPDGASAGAPLMLAKTGAEVLLDWDASCNGGDTDYEVYEGALGSFASHEARLCSTLGATTATLAPMSGDAYYLVVPRNAEREGSYGVAGDGEPRPAAVGACVPQALAPACE